MGIPTASAGVIYKILGNGVVQFHGLLPVFTSAKSALFALTHK